MPIRVYLTGRMSIENEGKLLDQREFPASQGCLAFARLVLDRHHAVIRDELAEVLWPNKLPRAWGVALSAILSKLRVILVKVGL